ncbi:MAG TPA: DUF1634 domain-containing protein, partial [Symbiobacteriaceae bacterium]|nr:DUF1634 domain-containing protein [Symbiobacteriaceae bacterium]
LRIGAVLAAMLLAAGIALASMGMAPGLGPRLVTAGLLVLVSTPIIRVVVAMGVFVKTRDTAFAFFCLVVLALLSAGMLFGHTG